MAGLVIPVDAPVTLAGQAVEPEIEALEAYGVERIYTPEDGRKLGLDGMIADVVSRTRVIVLFGGRSVEREVSRLSARTIAGASAAV